MFIDWSRASDLEQGMENWPIEKFKSFKHPVEIMKIWMEEAAQSPDDGEPNAIVVSTSLLQRVSSRIVLLKEFTETGFIFYTNYNSRKGLDLKSNPYMGFNFYSPSLYVQITGEGKAFRLSEKKSQKYWDSRPRKSQLSQWVSQQSQPIKNRSELLQKLDEAEARFENKTIPKPNHWGGYEVSIYSLEFWMGKENRLHERVQFLSDETFRKWEISLLSP